eukprot:c17875_g1_i3.p1 GENE.c17875_g1_i3~~c17875_g1_i3.p1  ORF type:complete len:203 (+),score=27.48 c17875_g1_i3:17-625(+)
MGDLVIYSRMYLQLVEDRQPVIEVDQHTKWLSVFAQISSRQSGDGKTYRALTMVLDRISSFYRNIALLSALALSFLFQQITMPSDELVHSGRHELKRAGVFLAVMGMCAFLASIVIILILDNTTKSITTPAALRTFCSRFSYLLFLPTVLVMAGLCAVMAQLAILVEVLYNPGWEYYALVCVMVLTLARLLYWYIVVQPYRL